MPYFSRKHMQYRESAQGGTIEGDVHCRNCGYNVRGLTYGRACPECSTPITATRGNTLTDGPYDSKRIWWIGLSLLAWTVVATILARIMFTGMWLSPALPAYETQAGVGLALSCVWFVGIWMTFDVMPRDGRCSSRLITFARWSQFAWVLGYALSLAAYLTTAFPGTVLLVITTGVHLIAFVGTMLAMSLLSRVAADAYCEDAVTRIRRSLYVLPVTTLLVVIGTGPMPWIFLPVFGFVLLAWGYGMVVLALALFEMARHVGWTLRAAQHEAGKDARIAAQKAELIGEAERSIRPVTTHRSSELPYDS